MGSKSDNQHMMIKAANENMCEIISTSTERLAHAATGLPTKLSVKK